MISPSSPFFTGGGTVVLVVVAVVFPSPPRTFSISSDDKALKTNDEKVIFSISAVFIKLTFQNPCIYPKDGKKVTPNSSKKIKKDVIH